MFNQVGFLWGTVVVASLIGLPSAQAQLNQDEFLMGRAREACRNQAEQQAMQVNRVVSTTPIRTGGQATGAEVVLEINRNGSTTNARCTYDSVAQTTTIADSGNGNVPTEGSFDGRGLSRGSVFGDERQTDANLSYNGENFSFSLFVPPGTGAQVNYGGKVTRLRNDGSNPNSFVFEGRVERFASSANNLEVIDSRGNCRIEIFDARIVSAACSSGVRDSTTNFEGLEQF